MEFESTEKLAMVYETLKNIDNAKVCDALGGVPTQGAILG